MIEQKNKHNKVILILSIVIVVLVLVALYFAVIKTGIEKTRTNLKNEGYVEGMDAMISSLLYSVQTQGYVQIPLAENQSLVLIPYVPQQEGTPITSEVEQ